VHIHALSTGTVSLKDAFLHARPGLMRQPAMFLPGAFSAPMPIHVWLIEHDGQRILVDTGETADVRDLPFCRFTVRPEDELRAQLEGEVDTVVLTHMHGDHVDGTVHLGRPVLVHDVELAYQRSPLTRIQARMFRQPVPKDVDFRPLALDAGPFGAFAASHRLSDRVIAVATPGHTPGHMSIVVIDDEGRHVLLAGDTTDSLEQLRARRTDAVSPKPKVTVETIDRILAHGKEQPTVYLPSHDPESVDRLAAGTTL
jgi:glyoxylase-like metal-dependent hydrolase (beta-lactamase superfamily II)